MRKRHQPASPKFPRIRSCVRNDSPRKYVAISVGCSSFGVGLNQHSAREQRAPDNVEDGVQKPLPEESGSTDGKRKRPQCEATHIGEANIDDDERATEQRTELRPGGVGSKQ